MPPSNSCFHMQHLIPDEMLDELESAVHRRYVLVDHRHVSLYDSDSTFQDHI